MVMKIKEALIYTGCQFYFGVDCLVDFIAQKQIGVLKVRKKDIKIGFVYMYFILHQEAFILTF